MARAIIEPGVITSRSVITEVANERHQNCIHQEYCQEYSTVALLSTAINVSLPVAPARADVLGGGLIGASRGTVTGAVVGAVVEDNHSNKENRGKIFEKR